MRSSSNSKHRTVPFQETISCVDGYPNKLKIFQIPASRFWWVRYYSQNKVFKKSTKTTNKSDALSFAKKFYEQILLSEWNLLPVKTTATFEQVALLLIDAFPANISSLKMITYICVFFDFDSVNHQ